MTASSSAPSQSHASHLLGSFLAEVFVAVTAYRSVRRKPALAKCRSRRGPAVVVYGVSVMELMRVYLSTVAADHEASAALLPAFERGPRPVEYGPYMFVGSLLGHWFTLAVLGKRSDITPRRALVWVVGTFGIRQVAALIPRSIWRIDHPDPSKRPLWTAPPKSRP